jgi:hypothetical protein
MIALDQSGEQCSTVVVNADIEALAKPDPLGGTAVLLVSLGTGTATARFALSDFGITSARARVSDVWTGETTTVTDLSVTLEAGQTVLMQIEGV